MEAIVFDLYLGIKGAVQGSERNMLAIGLVIPSTVVIFLLIVMTIFKRSVLSDETMECDMVMIRRLIGSESMDGMIQKTSLKRDSVIDYYRSTTGIDYRILQHFIGHGMHSFMTAKHPILNQCGNTRQGIMIMGEIRAVRASRDSAALPGVETMGPSPLNGRPRVLEVGCGRGHCSLLMAGLCEGTDFYGIDLLESHVGIAKRSALIGRYENVSFGCMDIKDFPICGTNANTYDAIFGCESLCHMDTYHDMDLFVRVARNLLRRNGRVIICDGFRGHSYTQCNTVQKDCMMIAESGFSIRDMPSTASWTTCFESHGFRLVDYIDLTMDVLPFWTLGWRVSRILLMIVPCLFRYLYSIPRLQHSIHSMVSAMTVAQSLRSGAADYGIIVFELLDQT